MIIGKTPSAILVLRVLYFVLLIRISRIYVRKPGKTYIQMPLINRTIILVVEIHKSM